MLRTDYFGSGVRLGSWANYLSW